MAGGSAKLVGFDDAREEWERITARFPRRRFFQRRAFFEACCASVFDRAALRFLSVPGRVLLPLSREFATMDGVPELRVLSIPHDRRVDLYDGLVEAGELAAVGAALEALEQAGPWDVLWIPRVLAESSLLAALRRLAPPRLAVTEVGESKSVSLRAGYEAATARMSHKFVVNERRKLRRLAETGRVEVRRVQPQTAEDPAYRDFVRLEGSGWKNIEGSAIVDAPESLRLFAEIVGRLGAEGDAHVDLLCLDGRPIAGQLALSCDGTYSLLKIGYDEAHRAVGPGGLLIHETLRLVAAEARHEELSFVTGAPWNDNYGARGQAVYDVRLYNDTPRGRLAHRAHELKPRVARALAWWRARREMREKKAPEAQR